MVLAHPQHTTEPFAWLVTVFTAGTAANAPIAGWALGGGGAPAAAVAAAAAVALALGSQRIWARRDAVRAGA